MTMTVVMIVWPMIAVVMTRMALIAGVSFGIIACIVVPSNAGRLTTEVLECSRLPSQIPGLSGI